MFSSVHCRQSERRSEKPCQTDGTRILMSVYLCCYGTGALSGQKGRESRISGIISPKNNIIINIIY